MMEWVRHVKDDHLLDSYYAERTGDTIDPRIADHLSDCPACRGRYAAVTHVLDEVRIEGTAEADAVFTADRLRAQRQQILRRLDHANHPARVITFPGLGAVRGSAAPRLFSRWVAAAAAAGLFVGAALGASYQWEWHSRADRVRLGDVSRLATVPPRGAQPDNVAADDAFLSELDAALARPRTRELLAYDALTPHVRSVRDQQ